MAATTTAVAKKKKPTQEDLFSESTMTFGEHLEELRKCLWKAVLGLVICTIGGFFLGDRVVKIIEAPLKQALETHYRTGAETEYENYLKTLPPGTPPPYTMEEVQAIAAPDPNTGKKEFIFELEFVHGEGSRGRIAPLNDPATRDNLVPILLWHSVESDRRLSIQATGASEAFSVWLKASIVVGILIASPWIFYQIWTFVAAGLYPHEKKYVYLFLPFSLGLFLAGAATAYLFVFKPVLNFLFSFNKDMGIDPDPKINEWLGFVLILPLGFGVSFQLPLVMLFLERIGVFTVKDYLTKWRIAVLVIFIVSAILTPADPYSIFFMALPLTFLYFGGIMLAKFLPRKPSAA